MEATLATRQDLDLARLKRRFEGELITAEDERYGAARRLWNAIPDRRPAVILQPRSARDVAAAILYARERELEIAVRGGGHSIVGHSMSDGGVTIDLSAMNAVEVDASARRARVGGGALLADLATATSPHGLVVPFGHISHTGVGGFTLGGGIGWIMRKYGLACDNVRSLELVTAEGELVRASAEDNPDLFWALRGGSGNFGVVIRFEFELQPFPTEVLAGMLLYPLEQAADVLRHCRDFMDEAPEELVVFETLMTAPPEPPFPAELQGRPALGLGIAYAGDLEEGARVLRPLREYGPPALDLLGPMSHPALQEMLDPTAPHGMRNYNKAHFLAELPDDAIDKQVELHADVRSPMSLIINARMGGAIDRVPPDETSFGHRDTYRLVWIVSSWWEGDDAEQIEWCRQVFDAMSPYSTGGVYVNALDAEGPERMRAAYRDSVWTRLVEVKDRWDPDNVFRQSYNIPPSGGRASARARTA
jgi:FAD/FMN-containing dehydrogenase